MKYGFFGGSFNPPTCAHLELAKQAKKEFNLDKVFFVPVGNMYEKDNLVDEKFRYEMLELMCKQYDYLEVSNIELNSNRNYKAIDVFRIISEKYSNEIINNGLEIYFLLGSDNLASMEKWESSQELIKNYKYIVFERENEEIESIFSNNHLIEENKDNFKILESRKHSDISSTKVRDYLKQNNSNKVCDMVSEEVYEYIIKNKLYI